MTTHKDPAILELIESAHLVLAWVPRNVDTARLAAERLERALAGVKEADRREIVAGDTVLCDFSNGQVVRGTVLRVDSSQIPYLIEYETTEVVRRETWMDARSVTLIEKEGPNV